MRRLAPLVPLPFLLAFAAWVSARLADIGGDFVVAALSAVARVVAADHRPAENGSREPEEFDVRVPVSAQHGEAASGDSRFMSVAGAKRGKQQGARAAAPPQRSVYVSADTVLRLSEIRVTPKGVPVAADQQRPAGLRLTGVEGLGIGLRDGDVLTRALGQPALSSAAVVRAVLKARAARAKVLQGEFYRGGERWNLVVEQPYLDGGPRVTLTTRNGGPRLPEP